MTRPAIRPDTVSVILAPATVTAMYDRIDELEAAVELWRQALIHEREENKKLREQLICKR